MKQNTLTFIGKHFLCSSLCVALLAGCGGKDGANVPTGTVKGTVSLDGGPLTQGQVNFASSTTGGSAYGELQQDGSYELNGPIPVGDYKVYISRPDLGDTPPSEDGNPELNKPMKEVPEKFQSEATTDKTASVKKGLNTFDFDLSE